MKIDIYTDNVKYYLPFRFVQVISRYKIKLFTRRWKKRRKYAIKFERKFRLHVYTELGTKRGNDEKFFRFSGRLELSRIRAQRNNYLTN